jgi:hypothetical protein
MSLVVSIPGMGGGRSDDSSRQRIHRDDCTYLRPGAFTRRAAAADFRPLHGVKPCTRCKPRPEEIQ